MANGVTKEIKFEELLEYLLLNIMFWEKGSISNLKQVKIVMKTHIKDPSQLKLIVMRYMHEYKEDQEAKV